jgi:diguanylate cyclase (GGDEF)-like protein
MQRKLVMQPIKTDQDMPDFIMKSALGLAWATIIILTPFGILNVFEGRLILGGWILTIVIICAFNVWIIFRNKYLVSINLFALSPAITITIVLALLDHGTKGSYWAFLAVLCFYFILPKKMALIANIFYFCLIGPVAWVVLEQDMAVRFYAVIMGTSAFAYLSMTEITKRYFLLKEQAVMDSLTSLYNRSLLQPSLETAIEQSNRTNTPMTLIMFDIDYFKSINDDYGHDVGDDVLRMIGFFLKSSFRKSDMVFRVGGEEFLVLVFNTEESISYDMAEYLRKEIEELPLIPEHQITVSVGVAGLEPGMEWSDWAKACDEKLYHAKSNGRNQVS